MNKIEFIDPLKDSRWDRFVESHPLGWVCHLSGWKRVLEESFKHMEGYYFAIVDDAGKNIRAALPLYHVKSRLFGSKLVSLPFATLCDPLVSDRDEMDALLESAKKLAENVSARFIEIRTREASSLVERNEDLEKVDRFRQHLLPLEGNSESLMTSFHRTCVRKNIKKALKRKLKARISQTDRDIEDFFSLYYRTRKNNGLPALPLVFIRSIFREFALKNRVALVIAEVDTKPIAAMVLYKFKERMSAEFLGWDRSYMDCQPSVFIYWEAIKMAQEQGCKMFDFGRTVVNNQGLMDFKGHWGTQVRGLPNFYYPAKATKSFVITDRSLKMKVANGVFRMIPDILYLPLGNFWYRNVS